MKTTSKEQAIVQSTPLGVQLHHHFRSKLLVDTLHSHGFCCSYAEVTRLEKSAAVNEGTDIPHFREGTFVQYVGDNVDHNIRTLVRHNTFHGMGMITAVTPATSSTGRIPRVSVTSEDIAAIKKH